jgi:hypothetical protein
MTNSTDVAASAPRRSTGRLFAILTVFALAGPPIGGLAVSATLALLAAASHLGAGRWGDVGTTLLIGTLFGAIYGLPIAYFVGILPAAAVGLAVALWDRRKGLLSWRIALAAALVPWLFLASRAGSLVDTDDGTRIWQASVLIASLAASIACWWLARIILDRPVRPIGHWANPPPPG